MNAGEGNPPQVLLGCRIPDDLSVVDESVNASISFQVV